MQPLLAKAVALLPDKELIRIEVGSQNLASVAEATFSARVQPCSHGPVTSI
jgi:hypothetical protein